LNNLAEAQSLLEKSLPDVPRETIFSLLRYADLAVDWNHRINLTGAKSLQQFLEEHILDCVAAGDSIPRSELWCDVGTGAGLPGIVWSLLFPGSRFVLVESLQKKIAFLRRCISALQIPNARALHGRFESLREKDFPMEAGETLSCVSRGTASPPALLQMISQSEVRWNRWLVFSSEKTHEEFLTLSKNFGMEISRIQYPKFPSRSEKFNILTEISR